MNNDDTDAIYVRLAEALDALPQGFPRTDSGVEIQLMKMAFSPEEVWLAGQMSREYETVSEIAERVGRDEAEVSEILEGLVPRRLVRLESKGMSAPGLAPTVEGEKRYRLGPFMVGWYEANMRLMGKEYAELFSQYIMEGGGERILAPRPGSLGVIPVRGSLKPEQMAEMEPHLDIDAHLQRHERFIVIDCVCVREAEMSGEIPECLPPMKRCGFVGAPPQTPLGENVLDREQADKLLRELEELGRVHLAFYGFTMGADTPQFVGTCNCCSCCCAIIHQGQRLGLEEHVQRSNYRAFVLQDACTGCGVCVTRCPVDAISEQGDGHSLVQREKCIGCGVCVIGCDFDALELQPVSEEEWFHTPSSMDEWEEMRLQSMAKGGT